MDFDEGESLHFINSHPEINKHYEKMYQAKGAYQWIENGDNRELLKKQLEHSSSQYLTYGYVSSAAPVWLNIMADNYPYVVREVNYDNGSFYALAKSGKEKIYTNENCRYEDGFRSSEEWITIFEGGLRDLVESKNNVIDGKVIIDSTFGTGEIHWVWQAIDTEGNQLDWRSEKIDISENAKESFNSFFSVRLIDTNVPVEGSKVKVMLWNTEKKEVNLNNACLRIRAGNPWLYGLQHELK